MISLHRALRVALPVIACSCSSPSAPSTQPVIDSLTLPPSFTVAGNQYSVQGTITFHDAKGSVTSLHEKIPTYGLDQTVTIGGVGSPATVVLGFVASSPVASGTQVEIDVSVIDDNGVESNVEVEKVSVP